MKKKRLLLVVIAGMVIAAAAFYMQPVTFQKSSIYKIDGISEGYFGNEHVGGRSMGFDIKYQAFRQIEVLGFEQEQSSRVIDPLYILNEARSSQDKLKKQYYQAVQVNVIADSTVTLSTLRYREFGKEKTADIGTFHIGLADVKNLKEQDIQREEHRSFRVKVYVPEGSVLKEAACVNPDIDAKITEWKQEGNKYSFLVSFDLKDFELAVTNMRYILVQDGEEELRYGTGCIYIERNGSIVVGGYIDRDREYGY